jgi:hypothetical protein
VNALTPRQREVLEFVRSFTAGHGWAPSHREICVPALPRRYPPRTAGAIAVVVRPVEAEPVQLMWLGQIHNGRLVAA